MDEETPSKKRRVRVEKDAMDIDNYEDSSSRSSSESESEDSDIVIDVYYDEIVNIVNTRTNII